MYEGYLKFNNVEIVNAARTESYLKALAPGLSKVDLKSSGLRTALGHSAYTSPGVGSLAPWYSSNRTQTTKFYGLFAGRIEGVNDSTRKVDVTELAANGAIHAIPRHASRDIRVVATAFAADEEGMNEGLSWLRDVLAADGCGDTGLGCTGHDVKMYVAKPTTTSEASSFARTFYRTEVSDALTVTNRRNSKAVLMWDIEFTLNAGRPWAFTNTSVVGSMNLGNGVSYSDPANQNCSTILNPYNDFINDPYFTAITKPPAPPTVKPPNVLDNESWKRLTLQIPATTSARWGRVEPVVTVSTGASNTQFVRIRFFPSGESVTGCDFDGEFLVSYLPANATLTLDGLRRETTVELSDGRVVPAGHLLFGSDGMPFQWPDMGCQREYTMVADVMTGKESGVVVLLDTAVRE